jgi:hypothetical protein
MNQTNETINELQSSWTVLFPETSPPNAHQWAVWITRYGSETVRRVIAKLANRRGISQGDFAKGGDLYRFAEVLMGRLNLDIRAKTTEAM